MLIERFRLEIRKISGMRRVVGNAASLLTSNVMNRATTFVLYALIARYLSTFEFGQMSLALTYFYLFQVMATAGLENLMMRAVSNDRTKTSDYVVNGSLLVIIFSFLSLILLVILVRMMNYSSDTASIILLLALGLLPYSLSNICETVFKAWEQMHYIAYANVPVHLAKAGLAFLLLTRGYGLYSLVMLLLISLVAIMGTECWLMLRYIITPHLAVDFRFAFGIAKAASTFLGIEVIIAITSSINVLLLSKFLTETEVGLFSAAGQLTVPLQMVYLSATLSVFPLMCRKFNDSIQGLKQITEYMTGLLLAIALPSTMGIFFLSNSVVVLLYGNGFLPASGVLRILIWTLIPVALSIALGQVLFASLREKVTLQITIINVGVSLICSVILISQFGLIGAAIATLLTKVVDFVQHYIPVSKLLSGISLGKLAWKSVVASLCMAVYLLVMRNQETFLTIVIAAVVYAAALLVLLIWSNGTVIPSKAR